MTSGWSEGGGAANLKNRLIFRIMITTTSHCSARRGKEKAAK
jgi:hypothetical protein